MRSASAEWRDRTIQTFVRTNQRIRVPTIRCIGPDGNQIGIISTSEALRLAQQAGLDLVEIAPHAQPPVCRIMDFGKYKYEMEKKQRLAKKHQAATKMKEIQFHPSVADHDYQTKLRHIVEFLEDGHRVKVVLFFRGRESAHQELGFDVVNRVIRDTAHVAMTENPPKLMGRTITVILTPKPKSKQRPKEPAPGAAG